ncbi:hypothetical protein APY03_3140 [Variovorax sp. WDL1]|nr:hypothetical protein APY03_3140 [Variovorax sp. WDL1]
MDICSGWGRGAAAGPFPVYRQRRPKLKAGPAASLEHLHLRSGRAAHVMQRA